jgi:Tol biopolymer transport system component/DNA-binding winged helix-turn-helix (wHTH) protein
MPSSVRRESSPPAPQSTQISFDKFVVDTRSGELRKNSSRIRLQAQPFQLLVLLLRNAGEVVTREELCAELWPGDTFVDFEHSLAAAVNKVREALGDSPDDPKFIETLPKRGYRFIGKIKLEPPVVMPPPEAKQQAELQLHSRPPGIRWDRRIAIAATLVVIALAIGLPWFARNSRSTEPLVTVPFTSYFGQQTAPSVSPDGSRIAFSWDNRASKASGAPAYDLYVKGIGSETFLRLTNHPAEWVSSVWSPDGTQIAFHRLAGADNAIYVVSALGGPERKLHDTHTPYDLAAPLDWSPDGKWIAYADTEGGKPGDRTFLLNVETLETHEFPHDPSCNHEGLLTFSHDGRQLALLCVHSTTSFEYLVADLAGMSRRSVASVSEFPTSMAWSADDKDLIVSRQFENTELYEIRVSDGALRKIPVSPNAAWPALSHDGKKLAFAASTYHVNIWRRDLFHPAAPPAQVYTSTLEQNEAAYSPDGKHVAFDSRRSGIWSTWMADADGSNVVQISHDRLAGSPQWSPDSQKIVFQMENEKGLWNVYTADVADLVPRLVKTNISVVTSPSWSHDGKWIYFRGHQGVGHQLYRCPAEGGNAILIAASQDFGRPTESADGESLYFVSRSTDATVMTLALKQQGAAPQPLLGMPNVIAASQWALMTDGIYFTPTLAPRSIDFYDFATRKVHEIFKADADLSDGINRSPDGRYLLYSQLDENTSNIMLVSNFR